MTLEALDSAGDSAADPAKYHTDCATYNATADTASGGSTTGLNYRPGSTTDSSSQKRARSATLSGPR